MNISHIQALHEGMNDDTPGILWSWLDIYAESAAFKLAELDRYGHRVFVKLHTLDNWIEKMLFAVILD